MASIDGLSSGLDTSAIIRQLMQLERVPQQRLQAKQGATEAAITSLRNLNTKFLALATAAEKFGALPPGAFVSSTPKPTDWQLTTATSSDATRVSAQAVTGTPASSLTFNVQQLATATSYLGETVYTSTAAPFSQTGGATDTSITLTKGTAGPVTISTGSGSLADTVNAINAANAGVSASTVQVKPGEYQLQLTSTTTGEGAISLKTPSGAQVPMAEVVKGQNAVLVLGDGTAVSRASNTISDVLQGVTLTLAKADTQTKGAFDQPPVTISVTKDSEGIAARVQALVDAANTARQDAKAVTNFDAATKIKGRLYGDSGVRGLIDQVRTAVVAGDSEVPLAGVTVGRDGTISFDKAKFLERLAANPGAVEAALGKDGLAGRLHRLAHETSRGEAALGGPGLIPSAIKSRESQIATLRSNIDSWDTRLALKEKTLQRQYTALETALGKARSQGQWLAGQLASLPSNGG